MADTTRLKAMVSSGNCLNDVFLPIKESAPNMEFIAHFGAFPNDTCWLSHMVIPLVLWPERYELCFNNDRGIQWGERIIEAGGTCRSGLDFWMGLARRLGWEDHFPWQKEEGLADHRSFYNWLLAQSEDTKGIDVDHLTNDSELVCWPLQKDKLLRDSSPFFPTDTGKMEPTHAPDAIGEDKETVPERP
jgi:anaerobic selenocysteine-containing dehydrogenase